MTLCAMLVRQPNDPVVAKISLMAKQPSQPNPSFNVPLHADFQGLLSSRLLIEIPGVLIGHFEPLTFTLYYEDTVLADWRIQVVEVANAVAPPLA